MVETRTAAADQGKSVCEDGIENVIEKLRKDKSISRHVKDLLFHLYSAEEEMHMLVKRNMELQDRIDALTAENNELRRSSAAPTGMEEI